MMTRRRKERGGMFVCVCSNASDWETRESEKRGNKHNDEAGWIFFYHYFLGAIHERETHIIIILHTTNNI